MLNTWTIRRATGLGILAGLAALILWPIYAAYQEPILWLFLGVLVVTAFCGVSILLMSVGDMVLHQRGERLRPVRAFDIIVGLALAVPSLIQFHALKPF